MERFEITITESEVYVLENIEAKTETEAIEKAYKILESEGKEKYHNDSLGEAIVSGF